MVQYDPDIFAVVFTTFGLASVAFIGRLLARTVVTKVPLWWDDYLAIATYMFAIGWCAITLFWTLDAGLGLRLEDVKDKTINQTLTESRLLLFIDEIVYAFALAFAKLSILAFYWRMFSLSNIRIPIIVLAVCSMIWLIIRTFMAIFHCVPVAAFWDYGIKNATCNINDSQFFFGTVLTHLVIDIAILALPIMQVRNLQLRQGQKIAVIALFMFGTLVCVASIVVLIESLRFDPNDLEMPLNVAPIIIWATVEVNFAIVSACLPMLRPVFRLLVPGVLRSTNKTSDVQGKSSTGIKLTTITRVKESDESSSTHQLADAENGLAGQADLDYLHEGLQTFISSRQNDHAASPRNMEFGGAIHVKNEMTVQYEEAEQPRHSN